MEKLEKYKTIGLFAKSHKENSGVSEEKILMTELAKWSDDTIHDLEKHLENLNMREFHDQSYHDAKSLIKRWDKQGEQAPPENTMTEDRQLNVLKTWLESKLNKVVDLGTYFRDGKQLLELLQTCSGAGLPEEHTAKKVKRCDVESPFAFLKERKFNFGRIVTKDIQGGDRDQTINLLWEIYDFFVIGSFFPEVSSGQIGLLQWWQLKTYGYQYVKILDFLKSFQDGLAFLAVIHHYRPDLINYGDFSPQTPVKNLERAFEIAEVNMGIPRLFDAKELLSAPPEFESVARRYAAQFFLFFEESRKSRSKDLLKDIKNYFYGVPENMCPLCQHQVGSCEELCQHMEMHFGFNRGLSGVDDLILDFYKCSQSGFKCPTCKERYKTNALLFQHLKEQHLKNFSCKYRHCPYVAEVRGAITTHQSKHKGHSACPRCSGLVKE